jgi:hypothetical protein
MPGYGQQPGTPGYQPDGYPQPGYQQPGYQQPAGWAQAPQPGGPRRPPGGPPRGRHTGRNILIGVTSGVVVLIVIAVAGIALGHKTGSAIRSAASTAASAEPSLPESPPASAQTGAVGTTFTITSTDDSGNPVVYDVTLVAVSQDAAPDNSFDGASAGHHLASAEFKITGITGSAHDDANLDANAVGSNEQSYQASFSGLAAGTNFSSGDFTVAPGQTEVGYVSFEVPNSIQVSSVAWNPDFLEGQAVATWTVPQ